MTDTPLWSVMIPAYNPGQAIQVTIDSVLFAFAGRRDFEVVVVDDASDRPADLGNYGDTVRHVRFEENVGAVPNFNRALHLARGEFVHLLHADDFVGRAFYESLEVGLVEHGASAAACRCVRVDEDGVTIGEYRREQPEAGIWHEAFDTLAVSNRVPAASVVVRRQVYVELGGFDETLTHAADWDMWVRIAASKRFYYSPSLLASYRVHEGQHTAAVIASGQNIYEAIEVIERLPRLVNDASAARKLRVRALLYRSVFAVRTAMTAIVSREASTALQQVRAAAVCLQRAAKVAGSRRS